MKRLTLPGGGFFEIAMPRGGRFVSGPSMKGASGAYGGKAVAIGVGALFGAVLTWAILEIME